MTNNTIANVPRELLERVLNAGWGSETVNALDDLRDFLEPASSPANHVEDVRAMVADPSPAGMDGLEVVGTLRYFMDYPDSPHSAPGYITHQFNPASWDHAGEAAGEHKLCRLSDAQSIIDGLRGEVADLLSMLATVSKAGLRVRTERNQLRAELAAIKAQDTVGEVVGWYRLDRPYEMTPYPSVCATWHRLGAPVAPLYAAHAQQVSVPDGWRELAKRADDFLYSLPETDGVLRLRADLCSMLAAPAAPVADAGIVDMYRHLQKVTPYRFKKIQDASITDGGDVMYFHKDRFDAALLADMAAHCAAPATADSDVLECGE